MQGCKASTEQKWNTGVGPMLNTDGLNAQICCLQECGLPPEGSAKLLCKVQVKDYANNNDYIEIYQLGSDRLPRYLIYYNWDVDGKRVNLAVASRSEVTPDNVCQGKAVALVWGKDGPKWRPALGLRLSSGAWVFSIHGISPGGVDTGPVLAAVEAQCTNPWAVAGDFNREPKELKEPTNSEKYYNGNTKTYPTTHPVSIYDYCVARSMKLKNQGLVGGAVTSDHLPVFYEFS